MSASWTWTYLDADGAPLTGGELPRRRLPPPRARPRAGSVRSGTSWSRRGRGGHAARGRRRGLRPDEPAAGRVSARAACPPAWPATLERRLRAAQRDWRSPAVSAGVVRDGELVWSGHVGPARLDAPSPADDDTQFMIGSITKTFTAVLVMSLRDEGRLTLDDTLEDLPARARGTARYHPADARPRLGPAARAGRATSGRASRRPTASGSSPESRTPSRCCPPHHAFHYSNLAYAPARPGRRARRGQALGGRRRASAILDPLGMRRTGLTPADDRASATRSTRTPARRREEPRFDLRRDRAARRAVVDGRRHGAATPPTSPTRTAEVLRPERSRRCAGR